MWIWLAKLLLSAAVVATASEIAKRLDKAGAFVTALPWTSLLVMTWLLVETGDREKIANHAWFTFWYVLPTLPAFLVIPGLLHYGWGVPAALGAGAGVTLAAFALVILVAGRLGVDLI